MTVRKIYNMKKEVTTKASLGVSKARRAVGEAVQEYVASILNATGTKGTHAVDIITATFAIEVKALVDQKNDKITIKTSKCKGKINQAARKRTWCKKNKKRLYTLAVDLREKTPVFYLKRDAGSFRLKGMAVITEAELIERFA